MGIEENFPIEALGEIASIEANSREYTRPIYSLHKWWAKRFGTVFRAIGLSVLGDNNESTLTMSDGYISPSYSTYLQKHDFSDKVVLDPFMGGGTTLVELSRFNTRLIGCDINPVAWWTTKKELDPFDEKKFMEEFKKLENTVGNRIKEYYKTTCECGNKAEIVNNLWYKKVRCINCNKKLFLFKDYFLATQRIDRPQVICPRCHETFKINSSEDVAICPSCNLEFNPKKGNVDSGSYICDCGQKYSIMKSSQKSGKVLDAELLAVEYYCQVCKAKKYKKASHEDKNNFVKAKDDFLSSKFKDGIPNQRIPAGEKTKDLINYQYKYFYEMFNERQLLCISLLIDKIKKIPDQNIKEYLFTALSASLEYSNTFAKYTPSRRQTVNLFAHHAYISPANFSEINIWGVIDKNRKNNKLIGNGSFTAFTQKILKGKKYGNKPYEKYTTRDNKLKKIFINDEKIYAKIVRRYDDFIKGVGNCLLLCKTSENLPIEDKSVDAIITDPPYFNNVMYSELSDYFYVWLKKMLENDYDEFKPELTPKLNEIIVNKYQNKDEKFFISGLTNIFEECHRVLKDDGIMVFTYHHKETQAWGSVLKGVLNSAFVITSIYPIRSEPITSIHIKNKDSIEYDTIIVCRKKEEQREITLIEFEEELYLKTKKILSMEIAKYPNLSDGDISVIVFGKCLEIYSKYYPNITSNGEPVSVETATDKVWEIIEQLSEADYMPPELDPITRAFTLNLFEPGGISYNELNKRLRQRGIDISELDAEQLISGPKNAKGPADPFSRKNYIEGKLGKDGDILDIDKVQYLFILYTTDKNPSEWLRKWKTPELEQLCKILAEKTGDSRYANVMELTLDMF